MVRSKNTDAYGQGQGLLSIQQAPLSAESPLCLLCAAYFNPLPIPFCLYSLGLSFHRVTVSYTRALGLDSCLMVCWSLVP